MGTEVTGPTLGSVPILGSSDPRAKDGEGSARRGPQKWAAVRRNMFGNALTQFLILSSTDWSPCSEKVECQSQGSAVCMRFGFPSSQAAPPPIYRNHQGET